MKRLIIILYSLFLLLFTIFSYVFVDPNLTYFKNFYSGFALLNRSLTTILYSLSIVIFFVFYIIFIYLGVKRKINIGEVFMLLSITVLILFLSYPAMLSYDVFNYIATSKVSFFYHENPYIIMPVEFVPDPLLGFTHAANKIALYGPVWIILTGIPYLFGFGNFIVTLFSFKLLIVIFYLLTAFLIWKMSKNIVSVILFSLNPLVIIEPLVSGHNDIVMMLFTLLSFFLLAKKRISFGVLLFIFAIFIKYAAILLVPVFLHVVWRQIKKKEINWTSVYFFSSLLMLFAFLLSPIREEIYSWYAIWYLSFSFMSPAKKILIYISIAFSFGLLFRYVPFMLLGTHAGIAPLIKSAVTFLPPFLVGSYLVVRKEIWERTSFR